MTALELMSRSIRIENVSVMSFCWERQKTMRVSAFESAGALLKVFALILCVTALGNGQQGEIPPMPVTGTHATDPAAATNAQRIVEGRPALYGVRQHLHPVSWFEAGAASLLNVAQNSVPSGASFNPGTAPKPPKTSGVKFGLRGLGAGSGFGPDIKFSLLSF